MHSKTGHGPQSPLRCGIVLAGGEGKRLRRFIHRAYARVLPKQYVNFIGTRSMLEHSLDRAEKLIPPERLFTVVSEDHLGYPEVRQQLSTRPKGTIVVQPKNKETGPGLLLPLVHLCKCYPESTVAVFPSDHFIVEEDLFMVHVYLAFRVVERDPSRLVLLGIEPSGPESEYGYILPGKRLKDPLLLGACEVSQFIEKPGPSWIQELILRGGLWNTMVMIFNPKTLFNKVHRIAPALWSSFERIRKAVGERRLGEVMREVYERMEPVNFSKGLLESLSRQDPSGLMVLPVRGVHWSDWGSRERIQAALLKAGFFGRLNGIPEGEPFEIWKGVKVGMG